MKDSYYFPHDCNARNDLKILPMRKDYGAKGYGFYWMLIEIMREQANYMLTVDDCLFSTLAMQLNVSSKAIESFMDDCLNKYKLFKRDNGYIYSQSLINRMKEVDIRREKARASANKRWNKDADDTQCDTDTNAMQSDSVGNASKVKESKVKKGKKSKPSLGFSTSNSEKYNYAKGIAKENDWNNKKEKRNDTTSPGFIEFKELANKLKG